MLHDIAASALAWTVAFWLRFNLELPPAYGVVMLDTLPLVVAVQAVLFWRFGLYRGIWRYASLHDLRLIVVSITVATLAIPAVLVLLRMAAEVPRSVFLLDPLLLACMMGGSRLGYRAWKEGRIASLATRGGRTSADHGRWRRRRRPDPRAVRQARLAGGRFARR